MPLLKQTLKIQESKGINISMWFSWKQKVMESELEKEERKGMDAEKSISVNDMPGWWLHFLCEVASETVFQKLAFLAQASWQHFPSLLLQFLSATKATAAVLQVMSTIMLMCPPVSLTGFAALPRALELSPVGVKAACTKARGGCWIQIPHRFELPPVVLSIFAANPWKQSQRVCPKIRQYPGHTSVLPLGYICHKNL